jgi:outer membrane protein TolC
MKAFYPLFFVVVFLSSLVSPAPKGWAEESNTPAATGTLTLPVYLDQVKQGNLAIQAAISNNHALDLSVHEAEAAFSPYLSGELSHVDTVFPYAGAINAMFTGERYWDTYYDLSLVKRWATGTLTSVSYRNDWTRTEYPGGGFSLGPGLPPISLSPSSDPYYTAGTNITISQPLWKDFMAAGQKATIDKVQASSTAAQLMNKFKIQQILFAANQAYIQLSLARSVVEIQTASLERNRKILAWAQAREASNLSDRVDTLQSEAAVKQVEVSLTQSKEDLQNALTQFNTLRGHDQQESVETLSALFLAAWGMERKTPRADLQAADWDVKSRKAAVTEVTQRYLPDISLYASATLNGRDDNYSDSFSQSFDTRYPTTAVGIKFTANLDLPLIHDTLAGAKLVSSSGDEDFKQKQRDLDRDWANLLRRWESVNQRLQAARELEALQREKADREKARFRNGRTTNYQVLRFEEDYDQAQLLKLRYLAEAAVVLAQAQLYNGDLY